MGRTSVSNGESLQVWIARGRNWRAQRGRKCGYLVPEVGHRSLAATRQSSCEVRGTPDVVCLVIRII
jgi:hypothetical protein